MNRIIVALALLSACLSPPTSPETLADSGVSQPDAAAPPQNRCAMGNMPTAITQTLTDADPVPSALLNEIQDMIVGSKHPSRIVHVPASSFCLVTGTATLSDGQWTATAASTKFEAGIVIPQGTAVEFVGMSYIRQAGGSSSYTVNLKQRSVVENTSPASSDVSSTTQNNGVHHPNVDQLGSVVAHTVPAGRMHWIEVTITQSGAAFDAKLLSADLAISRL